jgi:phage terminase small subunit
VGGYGSGGHNRKSDSAKILSGSFRKPTDQGQLFIDDPAAPGGQATHKPRQGLSREAKRLWKTVVEGWEIDSPGLTILRQVCECHDRLREAQAILRREGLTIMGRNGMISHPALKIEKDSRESMIKFWRLLALDMAAPPVEG